MVLSESNWLKKAGIWTLLTAILEVVVNFTFGKAIMNMAKEMRKG